MRGFVLVRRREKIENLAFLTRECSIGRWKIVLLGEIIAILSRNFFFVESKRNFSLGEKKKKLWNEDVRVDNNLLSVMRNERG